MHPAVGLDPENVTITVPEIDFLQEELPGVSLGSVPVEPDRGCIIVVSRT